jgi:DNA repair protein RecN (Recombination protein N)
VAQVLQHKEKRAAELDGVETIETRKQEYQTRLSESETRLWEAALELSARRRTAAAALEEKINAELASLNFTNARFAIAFGPEADARRRLSENGADAVEFLMSANKGQPLLPLVKVASGGEMSRMLLAFKAVTGEYDRIPTMIFDEIDSGISGVTASIVGQKLAGMAKTRQIICITHLPQIAAYGAHHFGIKKSADDQSTYTTVSPLGPEARTEEIARLLGGVTVTESTRESARELIRLSSG